MASDVGKQNLVLLVPLILICAGVLAWMYWPKPGRADADQLAQQALTGENQIVQVQAAVRLRAQGYTPQLREVMAQSRDVDVRATAVQALGDLQDFVSVPELLRLCDDPSPLVRGRAGAALCNILGADFPFQADMPAAERSKVIEAMQRMYEKMRRHPPDKYRSQIP